MKKWIISLLFLFSVSLVLDIQQAYADQEYIRIGSFNIANFGDTNEYERSLINLVIIILKMDADVIALQEIEPNALGHAQVARLTALLNKATDYYETESYEYIVSEDYTGDEQVAYLWRDPVSLESEVSLIEHDSDPDNDNKHTFQRVPSVALFMVGDYDFYLVNCHLYTKLQGISSEGRGAEYDALVGWLKDLEDEDEKDAIVVGDFNRFLSGKGDWSRLMIDDHNDYFRFPLLEAIKNDKPNFNPMTKEAPEDKYSTTTGKTKRIYDQILISKSVYDEFTDTPQWGD